ncbi:MAG: hypothetical protein U0289_10265 [Cyclobacteriaceae bacterium]
MKSSRSFFVFSAAGKWAFVLAILMIFSSRSDYRLPVAGLLVHPYLILLPFAFLFSGFRFQLFPNRILTPIILFFILFCVASLQNDKPQSEIFKVAASLITFIYFSASVRSESDFTWVSWALLLCALSIGVQGFLVAEETDSAATRLAGINVLEGIGNKNAQSLFTLPGIFLGSVMLLRAIGGRKFGEIVVLSLALFVILISMFLSGNRSGWLGLLVIFIAMLVITGLRPRAILFSLVILGLTYVAIGQYASDIVERKREQTTSGYSSDIGRRMLMVESMRVGLEHPFSEWGWMNCTGNWHYASKQTDSVSSRWIVIFSRDICLVQPVFLPPCFSPPL